MTDLCTDFCPKFKVWRIDPKAKLPVRAHHTDVGWDIATIRDEAFKVDDHHSDYHSVRTGLVIQPPWGFYFELVPRSSLFKNFGLILVNSVGIIDPTYCGKDDELQGLFWATRQTVVPAGTRILQLIPRRFEDAVMVDMEGRAFVDSNRGGVGSTGV